MTEIKTKVGERINITPSDKLPAYLYLGFTATDQGTWNCRIASIGYQHVLELSYYFENTGDSEDPIDEEDAVISLGEHEVKVLYFNNEELVIETGIPPVSKPEEKKPEQLGEELGKGRLVR